MKRVAVIGAGWAGLAAAVELAAAGVPVTVFEAARQLGGRARSVQWQGLAVDNGQHILIGAYRQTLRLLRRVGTEGLLERRPLDLSQPPHFRMRLPRLPAPLHLAAGLALTRGLTWRDKFAAARFVSAVKKTGYRLAEDSSVAELLAEHGQSEGLRTHLWEPLCLAALNTPLEQASAQIFCNVLRDSLGGDRAASDLLLPRIDLGRLFPEAAAEFIRTHGGRIQLETRVIKLEHDGSGYRVNDRTEPYSQVVCAVHPAQLGELLAWLPGTVHIRRATDGFSHQPIQTLWLRFEEPLNFPAPMLGLAAGPGQWAFDRRDMAPGLVSVVISAVGPHQDMDKAALIEAIQDQLRQALGTLPGLQDTLVITEKRATFAATPKLPRPGNRTAMPGLFLAGDYTEGDYPATLEGAVRSGVQCARLILASAAA